MEYYAYLNNLNLVIEIIAFILGVLILLNNRVQKEYLLLLGFLTITVLVESISTLLYYNMKLTGISNVLGLYNFYDIISFFIFFSLYDQLFAGRYRSLIFGSYFVYLGLVGIESIYFVDFASKNLIFSHIGGSLLLSGVVFLYFINILSEGSAGKLFNSLYFWFSCGLLLYYVGHIPFRVVINLFTFEDTLTNVFFYLRTLLRIMMFVLICFGLYRHWEKE